MKIIRGYPPNYPEIRRVFPIVAKMPSVVFAWNNIVFNPSGGEVPPAILAHEAVHSHQHGEFGGAESWWDLYLSNERFRYEQELEAHRAEYRWWLNHGVDLKPPRGFRSMASAKLVDIANRLSSPLYGCVVTPAEARRLISA